MPFALMAPPPFDTITPPLWAVVEVKLIITAVVATVGTFAVTMDVGVFLQPVVKNMIDKKRAHREKFRKDRTFMQIKR
jgi:hypothetical protein